MSTTWFNYIKSPNKNLLSLPSNSLVKLNIASGPSMFPFPEWINYDHENFDSYIEWLKNRTEPCYMKYLQDLVNYVHSGGELKSIIHDLRDGFPMHEDNSVDMIYMGQAIEHLNPIFEVPQFLKECYRMLKSGKILRMTTPDLDLLINAYINNDMNKFSIEQPEFYKNYDASAQLAMLMYGSCGEKSNWTHYEGHQFLFTQKSMTKFLTEAGFKDIEYYYESGKSKDPIMAKECTDQGLTHSLIVECCK
jgi:predicted SAM-dependent methyltransferase